MEVDNISGNKRKAEDTGEPTESEVPAKKQKTEGSDEEAPKVEEKVRDEADIGIQLFRSPGPEVHSVLKHLYHDFIVHEIDPEGNIVRLTDQETLPPSPYEVPRRKGLTPDEAVNEAFGDKAAEVMKFLRCQKPAPRSMNVPAPVDKEKRKQMHLCVKAFFKNYATITKGTPESPVIKIWLVLPKHRAKSIQHRWPKKHPQHLKFVMYKENTDTGSAVATLCRAVGIKPKIIDYAGNKDKRGVTTQYMTAHRVTAEKLRRAGLPQSMRVGNFSYTNDKVTMGKLNGNLFTIVLREINIDKETIGTTVDNLAKRGFINYFGNQRFGTGEVGTHEIGLAMIQEEYEKAFKMILAPRAGETGRGKRAKDLYLYMNDIEAAIQVMPYGYVIEKRLLQGLEKSRVYNYLEAITSLPKYTYLTYLHAYQSYIWNHMATERLRTFGEEVLVGDLVTKEEKYNPDVPPVYVTEANKGEYTLNDVILPIPGACYLLIVILRFNSKYPKNEMGTKYSEFMAKDNIKKESFNPKSKTMQLRGSYRKLLCVPQKVSWEYVAYNDPGKHLALTDADALEKRDLRGIVADGKFKALVITFQLSSGCYATQCLRELTHRPMHRGFQKQLSALTNEALKEAADKPNIREDKIKKDPPLSKAEKKRLADAEKARRYVGPIVL